MLHDWTGTYSAGWIMHIGFVAVTSALYLGFKPASYTAATRIGAFAPGPVRND
jgi:hypothetical protein